MADFTPEEIEQFVNQNEIVFEDTNSAQSYKTNFLIIKRNFDKLKIYLSKMHAFIVYLYSLIDIGNITDEVLENLQLAKKFVNVNHDMVEDQVYIQDGFTITRLLNNIISIKRQLSPNTWNVDNIMVTVKDNDGNVVYPVITTKDNEIRIIFIDGISSNYRVILL